MQNQTPSGTGSVGERSGVALLGPGFWLVASLPSVFCRWICPTHLPGLARERNPGSVPLGQKLVKACGEFETHRGTIKFNACVVLAACWQTSGAVERQGAAANERQGAL
jgi:hypothetical protein